MVKEQGVQIFLNHRVLPVLVPNTMRKRKQKRGETLMMGFSRKGIFSIVIMLLFTLLVGCTGGGSSTYTASGKVIDDKGKALAGVKLIVTGGTSIPDATVKADGTFILSKLTKTCIITPHLEGYVFTPKSATIKAATTKLQFIGAPMIMVSAITVNPTTMDLTVGGASKTIVATVKPADATNKSVTWATSNNAVATVVNGVVTPKTAGTATITATTVDGGYTATVEVVVAAAADVEITAFDAIANVDAGKAGSAIYADAAAVIAALPTDVTANSNAVTVPVTAWVDTDSYDPAVAGSYTFTATLGAIPAGFANTGGYTATVEVVVYAATFFNVTYHINGGSGTVPTQAPLTSGDTFTVASPTGLTAPTYMQFKEWNTDYYGSGTGYAPGSTFTMGTSDVTLYAMWEFIYTVTFFAGANGSLTGTTEFANIMKGTAWETAVKVPTPVAATGFKFKDWTPVFPATVIQNATYTANFVALNADATLSDLTIGGTTVTGFNASTLTYNVELPAGTTTVPTVTATATDSKANALVKPAKSLPGSTTVLVTAEDGTTKTYTINFTVAVDKTALTDAITAANTNKSTAVVSVDGTDVEPGNDWVTTEVMTAYTDAIAAAQTIADKADATQTEVDDAVTALGTATTTFNDAKKDGIQSPLES